MPKTGDRCRRVGTYISACGPQWSVQVSHIGDEFPPCPHCHKAVKYRYVGPLP